jgi:hypothetical protein
MVAVPDWPQLPEVTRQRWVQMATLLSDLLQTSENSEKAQSHDPSDNPALRHTSPAAGLRSAARRE